MSDREFDSLLVRLYRDRTFRESLRRDAERALAEYDLTPEQKAALSRLQKRKTPPTRRVHSFHLTMPPKDYSFSLN